MRAIEFWQDVEHSLADGKCCFIAIVAKSTRHSPGTAGARMMIDESGRKSGTIGGGIMEFNLLNRAEEILKNGIFSPELQILHHQKNAKGEKSGLICGGRQSNVYALLQPQEHLESIQSLVKLLQTEGDGVLRIDSSGVTLNTTPLDDRQPVLHLVRKGDKWHYEEQLLNPWRIAIIGGGHCSLALSRIMHSLDYHIQVFDTRPGYFDEHPNPYATSCQIVEGYRDAAELIPFPSLTYIIVMTSDLLSDTDGLIGVLQHPFPFIGAMGSKSKRRIIFQQLKAAGVSDDDIARITAPVGLPMRSNRPAEIAVSIAAQILQDN